jgi:hypothetical protein
MASPGARHVTEASSPNRRNRGRALIRSSKRDKQRRPHRSGQGPSDAAKAGQGDAQRAGLYRGRTRERGIGGIAERGGGRGALAAARFGGLWDGGCEALCLAQESGEATAARVRLGSVQRCGGMGGDQPEDQSAGSGCRIRVPD